MIPKSVADVKTKKKSKAWNDALPRPCHNSKVRGKLKSDITWRLHNNVACCPDGAVDNHHLCCDIALDKTRGQNIMRGGFAKHSIKLSRVQSGPSPSELPKLVRRLPVESAGLVRADIVEQKQEGQLCALHRKLSISKVGDEFVEVRVATTNKAKLKCQKVRDEISNAGVLGVRRNGIGHGRVRERCAVKASKKRMHKVRAQRQHKHLGHPDAPDMRVKRVQGETAWPGVTPSPCADVVG